MRLLLTFTFIGVVITKAFNQTTTTPVAIDFGYNQNFGGFETMDVQHSKAFIIAEDVHNRRLAHAATLKLLQYLHERKNIRTLCIEAGSSSAYLINLFLQHQDTTLLREIVRHTFYWSQEHHEFITQLAKWNNALPDEKKITVESADMEIKQESVILAVNILMDGKKIPSELPKLETFRSIFKEKENHRNRFNGLNVRFYYDKERCSKLTEEVVADLHANSSAYKTIFGEQFDLFITMMTDLKAFYKFNYRTNSKFKFRDDIIYEKLLKLAAVHTDGFLYLVGGMHARPGASSHRLSHDDASPFKGYVTTINLTGRNKNGKYFGARAINKIAKQYPAVFDKRQNIIIKNVNDGYALLDDNPYAYTFAFEDNRHVKPFPNSYTGK